MNANSCATTDYENKSNWTLGENKPNSNPIKPNFRNAQMNVNLTLIKDYRKKDDFEVRKNKPNSKPISVKPKMNANVFATKDYENETAFRLQKNKPNSNPIKANFKKNECKLLCCRVKLFLLQLRQQDKTNAVSIERRPYEDKSFYPVAA